MSIILGNRDKLNLGASETLNTPLKKTTSISAGLMPFGMY